jgi:hypothetical protein
MANLSLSIESNLDSGNARDVKQGFDGIVPRNGVTT